MRTRLFLGLILLFAAFSRPVHAQSTQAFAQLTSTTCPGTGCVQVSVGGLSHVGVQLTGTWAATAQFTASIDGMTFVALSMTPSNSVTTATSSTSNGGWNANVGGYAVIRVYLSAYTSGLVIVNMQGAP